MEATEQWLNTHLASAKIKGGNYLNYLSPTEKENLVVYNLSRSKINGHIKVHSIVYNTSLRK